MTLILFSCPQDSSIGDLVTNWLTHWHIVENTTIQHSERLVTLVIDEETWPDQQKENDNDKDKDN